MYYPNRHVKAQKENMTLSLTEDNVYLISGDSMRKHILTVDGAEAIDCSCPDTSDMCKHMIAFNEWLVDVVEYADGQTVEV